MKEFIKKFLTGFAYALVIYAVFIGMYNVGTKIGSNIDLVKKFLVKTEDAIKRILKHIVRV